MFFGTSFRQTILVNFVRKRAHSWDGNVNWAVILKTHNWSESMWTGLNRLRIGFNNRRLKEKRDFLYNNSTTKTYLLSSFQEKQGTRRDLSNFVARHCIPQQPNSYHETRCETAKVYAIWKVYRCNMCCKYNYTLLCFSPHSTPPTRGITLCCDVLSTYTDPVKLVVPVS